MPGYWGAWVPPQGNVSLPGCNPTKPYQCAILPTNQNPVFQFENATALTTQNYPTILAGVSVVPYTSSVTGKVMEGSTPEPGAQVSLLDPYYNGLVLVNNTTASNGVFSFNAPISAGSCPGGKLGSEDGPAGTHHPVQLHQRDDPQPHAGRDQPDHPGLRRLGLPQPVRAPGGPCSDRRERHAVRHE